MYYILFYYAGVITMIFKEWYDNTKELGDEIISEYIDYRYDLFYLSTGSAKKGTI
ncbi:MAG: hypothetical protein J6A59_00565 [Lachnospiraceae bacterium]|nr:hypothetical protein [Lachnospiraceae bacterium]